MIGNKFKAFCKKNLGLLIVGSTFITGGVMTAILITTLPDPRYKIESLGITGGPSNEEHKPWPDARYLWVNLTTHETGNNDPFQCEVFYRSINGGKIPTTKNGQPLVKWIIHRGDAGDLHDWFYIGNKDDTKPNGSTDGVTWGKLLWDWDKAIEGMFWVMVTAELQKERAYSELIFVDFRYTNPS